MTILKLSWSNGDTLILLSANHITLALGPDSWKVRLSRCGHPPMILFIVMCILNLFSRREAKSDPRLIVKVIVVPEKVVCGMESLIASRFMSWSSGSPFANP